MTKIGSTEILVAGLTDWIGVAYTNNYEVNLQVKSTNDRVEMSTMIHLKKSNFKSVPPGVHNLMRGPNGDWLIDGYALLDEVNKALERLYTEYVKCQLETP